MNIYLTKYKGLDAGNLDKLLPFTGLDVHIESITKSLSGSGAWLVCVQIVIEGQTLVLFAPPSGALVSNWIDKNFALKPATLNAALKIVLERENNKKLILDLIEN